jgi:hypothetical protein
LNSWKLPHNSHAQNNKLLEHEKIHGLIFHDSKHDSLANKQISKFKTQNGKNKTNLNINNKKIQSRKHHMF